MSKAKHTPGPWTVDRSQSYPMIAINAVEGLLIRTAYIAPQPNHNGDGVIIELANANLIATAPDLLEALKELEQLVTAHITDEADNWCRNARAAIAKAERGE